MHGLVSKGVAAVTELALAMAAVAVAVGLTRRVCAKGRSTYKTLSSANPRRSAQRTAPAVPPSLSLAPSLLSLSLSLSPPPLSLTLFSLSLTLSPLNSKDIATP